MGPLLSWPHVVLAAILLLVGFIVGTFAKSLVIRLFKRGRVDDVLVATGAQKIVEKSGFSLDTGAFAGTLLKWFIILFFLDVALNVLNLQAATAFLGGIVLTYLPRIFVAAAILFAAFVLAHMVRKAIIAGAQESHVHGAKTLASLIRYVILLCAGLAAMVQLRIAPEMALIAFGGIVFTVSLTLGIAFGFGSREAAARYVNSVFGRKDEM